MSAPARPRPQSPETTEYLAVTDAILTVERMAGQLSQVLRTLQNRRTALRDQMEGRVT